MANPGGVGSKFVSVNLNKSYGPSSHHHSSSSSYGQAVAGRVRTGPHGGGGGGGGGGGMVVLSRPKSSQKTVPKLSVPPPLNLPSMRKEHERFDLSGSGAGSTSTGGSGTVPRPTSSGMGWTKTGSSVGLQDKNGKLSGEAHGYEQGMQVGPDGTSSYTPFLARSNGTGIQGSISAPFTMKGPMLRGEDFPSLQASLPTPSSGPVHKAKDGLQKTQKHVTVEDSFSEQTDGSLVKPLVDMRPHSQSSNYSHVNGSNDNNSIYGLGSSHSREQSRKHEEYLPGAFPLLRLNPRSDWADDERDTGIRFSDRTQNHVFSKIDAQWDGEFDIPKHSAAKQVQYDRWSHRDDIKAKIPHNIAPKSYPYQRDVGTPNGEGNMQRTAPIVKHVSYSEEIASDRYGAGERSIGHKYAPPRFGDNLRDDRFIVNQESFPGRKDVRFTQEGRHQWNQDRYKNEQSNRNHAKSVHNPVLKSSYSTNKWAHMNDSVLNYSREKPPVSKVDRPYLDDPFLKDHGVANFDEIDPLTGTILGVIKRKKDVKQADFHDPVRESFEAELERVQQMQEKERQRIYEEQERVMEQTRREEEDRHRMIREEEERHKRLEEESRVAARREEHERLEAIRMAEEQRIARDEEKHRILMEEERSKERAKQKLLELEARIAKRQSEASKSDPMAVLADEKDEDIYRTQEADNWEDSERMVERITTSAHSESSSDNKHYDSGLRPQPAFRDGYSVYPDRAKPSNLWRRDILEDGNNSSYNQNEEENGHHRHMQNASSMVRDFPRKELHGRNSQGGVINNAKDQRWSSTVSGDIYNRYRETNNDFDRNFAERYGAGWGEGYFRGNPSHFAETDELYSYTRSRYPARQPRVLLPPPSLESIHKTSFRVENEGPGSSCFGDEDGRYNHHASRSEPSMPRGYYNAEKENSEASADVQTQKTVQDQRPEECCTTRCDSQSSLSLSSPPDSPVHLSHDDLDEYEDSPVISVIAEGKELPLSANETFGKENHGALLHSISAASVHEDWAPEDERDLLGQEEYDENEDGYNIEEEIHEGKDEQMDLNHEFEDLHLELEDGGGSLVLGFNDGVEVGIPNDDEFDRNSKNERSAFGVSEVQVQEQGRVDRLEDVEENLEPVNGFSVMDTENSSRMIEEIVTSKQDFVTQPVSETYGLSSSSDTMTATAVSSSSSHTDLPPTKLHFGLFSGPSLISSPFPAIQIGSIQMPLHLHSTVGPTLSHVHSSQPSFFQFGQFRYASPISQGILPISPQTVSNVQSNSGQSSESLHSIQPGLEKSSYNITNNAQLQNGQTDFPHPNINKVNEFTSLVDGERNHVSALLKGNVTEKESGESKALGSLSGAKGNRSDYPYRNVGSRSSYPKSESSHSFSAGFQRRPRRTTQRVEFKVWESVDKKQSSGQVSSNNYFRRKEDKSNFSRRTTNDYAKRESKNGSNSLPMKPTVESLSSGSSNSHVSDPARRHDKKMVEQGLTQSGDENLKKNTILPEEDEDAPLRSGVVRVFKQSGIEVPSDEDDFIEVRSKRQMLNVRREQREKEIKANSRVPKAPPRRLRSTPQTAVSSSSNRSTTSVASHISKVTRSDFGVSQGKILANIEASTGLQTIVSPPLAPIGTPGVSSNVLQADKRPHNVKAVSTGGEVLGSGVIFQSKSKILDSIQTSLSSWNNNSRINEQVLSLTQTQLDDAMKPHKYEPSVTSIMDHGSVDSDVAKKDKISSSATNPINSLLAGEKIQFGAVTSPSILLPINRVVKHGSGAPGPSRPDIKITQNVAAAKNNTAALFNKDKHPNKPCTNVDVAEAEAEAAGSAVAFEAISSDEVKVGNGLLGTYSITGLNVDQPLVGHSRSEDSLSVSLPADLSVENPPISFWPGLLSPHSSSNQSLPHFSGGGPSHFPFFEMNHPMLGGPVFAFGRQDEPSSSQQSQNNSNSTPMSVWQQCHSGIESFYGCPPTGFTGPFLSSSPGGGGGVQGLPPHMVVYNHFAPVGQYGGLSFMGTTFIPSGKQQHQQHQQPDWNHNPAAGIINEGGDVVNMVNTQRIPPPPSLATTTVQHLATSSPHLSMLSPLPMFDVSPYQAAPDMSSVQGRWSHISSSSVAVQQPQQQNESTRLSPPQFSQVVPPPNVVEQVISRFNSPTPAASSPSDTNRNFDKIRSHNNSMLIEPHSQGIITRNSSGTAIKPPDSANETNSSHIKNNNGFKWQPQQQQQQQQKNVYNNHQSHQRKNEWSSSNQNHHRMGFHGRNQSIGRGDKNYPYSSSSTKMKQIYVPKTTQNPTSG
ncbi:uncharacterized protein LOC124919346 [Impatiens glandulifera]|uniref:uncharacterized protein LOC124919346 n=1 Tax=Impatiens glandulifera TaxID=253017 RepID=UPI001FB05305|nr:uncharacterized protein LOC124919346 [Impatiens glandulifera]